ncbi:MAG: cobalamin-binding protein [Casimicrobiaceae bacterium]
MPGTGKRAGPLRLCAVLMLAALAALVAAFGASAAASSISVTDDEGKVIALAQPARRIISLAPHVTELLFAAGAGERIVGTIRYSDYPPAALKIPRIGDSFVLDSERVVALKPDLLIVWLHGNPEGQLDKLRRLGIPVFSSEPGTLADIASTIRRFGVLAGTVPVAAAAASAFERDVTALRERYAARPVVRVFYQVAERPLLTINGRHLIDDVIRLCGGRNVFAGLGPLVPTISPEAVVAADPEAIVTAGGESGNESGLGRWSKIASLTATRRGNTITLFSDTISRQSDRVLDGARALCERLEEVRARRLR